jgi:hypothetical protein
MNVAEFKLLIIRGHKPLGSTTKKLIYYNGIYNKSVNLYIKVSVHLSVHPSIHPPTYPSCFLRQFETRVQVSKSVHIQVHELIQRRKIKNWKRDASSKLGAIIWMFSTFFISETVINMYLGGE